MNPEAGGDPLEQLFRDMKLAAAPAPSVPGYRLLERAGTGGFGTVYRARDLQLERDVALKILHVRSRVGADAEERFLREARTLARVRHPNVVTLYGVIEHEDLRALSTEYIEGRPLEEVARGAGIFPVDRVIGIGRDLCRALAAVHAAGIVHRDVKTTNILVEDGGRIVLADFGLGIHLARTEGGAPSYAAGTPVFMAPEVLRGEQVDARSDVYALGVVLYRLAAGRLPFEQERLEDLRERIARGDRTPGPEPRNATEAGLWLVIEKAMSVLPDSRFGSAQEMEGALAALAGPSSSATAPARPRRRPMALALAAGAAVLGTWTAWEAWREEAPGGEFHASARLEASTAVAIEAETGADVHVYLLLEDRRGRRYLLFPRTREEATRKLAAGRSMTLGGEASHAVPAGPRDSLVLLATRKPLFMLVDSIPPDGSSATTGKEGAPRLKPIAVRGLLRALAQAGWLERADGALGESQPVLSERLPPLPHSAPSRGEVWAARHVIPEGAGGRPDARERPRDDEDDDDDK